MTTISVRSALRFGWETFKKHPWIFVQAQLVLVLISIIESMIEAPFDLKHAPVLAIVFGIISAAISVLSAMGYVNFMLKAHDAPDQATLRNLWRPVRFVPFALLSLLTLVILIPAYLLFIVPGIILSLAFMFSSYYVIEKGTGPVEALKASWRLTKGNRWMLLRFGIAYIGLILLGILMLVVGLLVTVPVGALAMVHIYRTLEGAAREQENPAA
jgi:uncharacterized membrane protein